MTTSRWDPRTVLARFFGVVGRGRSYLNALYLLLAFPLGVVYFCFLAVGLSLGLGLVIVWVGLLVLAVVLLVSWLLSSFERQQAIWLLGAPLRADAPRPPAGATAGARLASWLRDRLTWTGPVFLLLKLPLGVASFVLAVFCLSLSLVFLLAPVNYPWEGLWFEMGAWEWHVDTLPEALVCSAIGFLLLVLSLHLLNAVAWVWKRLALVLLERGRSPQPAPTAV
ncbi:MAG: sensor domain-containing protein [Thermoanaerobaculia bacterium]|nr:sensor domain-containing protein [Thermoanaerobaculia bacterium]